MNGINTNFTPQVQSPYIPIPKPKSPALHIPTVQGFPKQVPWNVYDYDNIADFAVKRYSSFMPKLFNPLDPTRMATGMYESFVTLGQLSDAMANPMKGAYVESSDGTKTFIDWADKIASAVPYIVALAGVIFPEPGTTVTGSAYLSAAASGTVNSFRSGTIARTIATAVSMLWDEGAREGFKKGNFLNPNELHFYELDEVKPDAGFLETLMFEMKSDPLNAIGGFGKMYRGLTATKNFGRVAKTLDTVTDVNNTFVDSMRSLNKTVSKDFFFNKKGALGHPKVLNMINHEAAKTGLKLDPKMAEELAKDLMAQTTDRTLIGISKLYRASDTLDDFIQKIAWSTNPIKWNLWAAGTLGKGTVKYTGQAISFVHKTAKDLFTTKVADVVDIDTTVQDILSATELDFRTTKAQLPKDVDTALGMTRRDYLRLYREVRDEVRANPDLEDTELYPTFAKRLQAKLKEKGIEVPDETFLGLYNSTELYNEAQGKIFKILESDDNAIAKMMDEVMDGIESTNKLDAIQEVSDGIKARLGQNFETYVKGIIDDVAKKYPKITKKLTKAVNEGGYDLMKRGGLLKGAVEELIKIVEPEDAAKLQLIKQFDKSLSRGGLTLGDILETHKEAFVKLGNDQARLDRIIEIEDTLQPLIEWWITKPEDVKVLDNALQNMLNELREYGVYFSDDDFTTLDAYLSPSIRKRFFYEPINKVKTKIQDRMGHTEVRLKDYEKEGIKPFSYKTLAQKTKVKKLGKVVKTMLKDMTRMSDVIKLSPYFKSKLNYESVQLYQSYLKGIEDLKSYLDDDEFYNFLPTAFGYQQDVVVSEATRLLQELANYQVSPEVMESVISTGTKLDPGSVRDFNNKVADTLFLLQDIQQRIGSSKSLGDIDVTEIDKQLSTVQEVIDRVEKMHLIVPHKMDIPTQADILRPMSSHVERQLRHLDNLTEFGVLEILYTSRQEGSLWMELYNALEPYSHVDDFAELRTSMAMVNNMIDSTANFQELIAEIGEGDTMMVIQYLLRNYHVDPTDLIKKFDDMGTLAKELDPTGKLDDVEWDRLLGAGNNSSARNAIINYLDKQADLGLSVVKLPNGEDTNVIAHVFSKLEDQVGNSAVYKDEVFKRGDFDELRRSFFNKQLGVGEKPDVVTGIRQSSQQLQQTMREFDDMYITGEDFYRLAKEGMRDPDDPTKWLLEPLTEEQMLDFDGISEGLRTDQYNKIRQLYGKLIDTNPDFSLKYEYKAGVPEVFSESSSIGKYRANKLNREFGRLKETMEKVVATIDPEIAETLVKDAEYILSAPVFKDLLGDNATKEGAELLAVLRYVSFNYKGLVQDGVITNKNKKAFDMIRRELRVFNDKLSGHLRAEKFDDYTMRLLDGTLQNTRTTLRNVDSPYRVIQETYDDVLGEAGSPEEVFEVVKRMQSDLFRGTVDDEKLGPFNSVFKYAKDLDFKFIDSIKRLYNWAYTPGRRRLVNGYTKALYDANTTTVLGDTPDRIAKYIKQYTPGYILVNNSSKYQSLLNSIDETQLAEYGLSVVKKDNTFLIYRSGESATYNSLGKFGAKYKLKFKANYGEIQRELARVMDGVNKPNSLDVPFVEGHYVPKVFNPENNDNILKYIDEELGVKVLVNDDFFNKSVNHNVRYNFAELGDYEGVTKINPYQPGDVVKAVMSASRKVQDTMSAKPKFLQRIFNNDWSINSNPYLVNKSDKEIFDIVKSSDGSLVMGYVVQSKKRGVVIRQVPVTDRRTTMALARKHNVVILPRDGYNKLYSTINNYGIKDLPKFLQVWQKGVMQTYKGSYLFSLGFPTRNLLDSLDKNTRSGGQYADFNETLQSFIRAHHMRKKYSEVMEKVIKNVEDDAFALTHDNLQEILKTLTDEERAIFNVVSRYEESHISGGFTKVIEQYFKSRNIDDEGPKTLTDRWSNMIWGISHKTGMFDLSAWVEDVSRLAMVVQELENGGAFEDGINKAIKNHFDYGVKSMPQIYAESVIPFITFPINNLINQADRVMKDPQSMKYILDMQQASWFQGEDDWDMQERRDKMYHVMSGNINLGPVIAKINPALFDSLNLVNDTYNNLTNRVAQPIKTTVNAVKGGEFNTKDIPFVPNLVKAAGTIKWGANKLDQRGVVKAVDGFGEAINQEIKEQPPVPSLFSFAPKEYQQYNYRYNRRGYAKRLYPRRTYSYNFYKQLYTKAGNSRMEMNMTPTTEQNLHHRVRAMKYKFR